MNRLFLPTVALVAAGQLAAQDELPPEQGESLPGPGASLLEEEERILPYRHPVVRYSETWRDSPFNREVLPPVTTTLSSSFGRNLVLTGLVNDASLGPIAYVRDTKENKSLRITSEASTRHPYLIDSAEKGRDPKDTKVVVTDGKEKAEITFEIASLTQAIQAPRQVQREEKPKGGGGLRPSRPANPEAARVNAAVTQDPAAVRQGSNVARPPQPNPNPPPTADSEPINDPLDAEPRRRRVPLPKPRED